MPGFSSPLSTDYPNRLAAAEPVRLDRPLRPWLLLGLVLICLAPRLILLFNVTAICPDGPVYLGAGEALAAGDWKTAFRCWKFHPLVLVLGAGQSLGLDAAMVGRVWNVTLASLAILPLFGWVRRQYDDRLAIAACLIYAAQATLVQWSHELMRDPTFWFVLFLSIYLGWRAVTEVRPVWFIAFGASTFVAMVTRKEGLLLVLPLCAWTVWRWWSLRQSRRRLLVGFILGAVTWSALVYAHGMTPPKNRTMVLLTQRLLKQWTGQFNPLFVSSSASTKEADTAAVEAKSKSSIPIDLGKASLEFATTVFRSLTPAAGLLMLLGFFWYNDLWRRRDHQPLFWYALLIIIAMFPSRTHIRYPLPMMLLGLPIAGLALLKISSWSAEKMAALTNRVKLRRVGYAFPAVLLLACGLVECGMKMGDYRDRQFWADWAIEVRQEYGPSLRFVGLERITRLMSYYADAECVYPIRREKSFKKFERILQKKNADVVILRDRDFTESWETILARVQSSGYRQIAPPEGLPTRSRYAIFFSDRLDTLASKGHPAGR